MFDISYGTTSADSDTNGAGGAHLRCKLRISEGVTSGQQEDYG